MTALRMALSEVRRLTSGRLPRAALLAMVVIPLLYGGLYLYANHDPYARLGDVPAALVDQDAGGTDATGHHRDVGAGVTRDLLRGHAFDWHHVSADEAAAGVRAGRYDFALTLPAGLTSALTSSTKLGAGGVAPTQGTLVLTTNDANNALARTISTQLAGTVRDSIATQVGQQAANGFLVGLATVHDRLGDAASGAARLADGAGSAARGATTLGDGADELLDGQRTLAAGAERLSTGAGTLSDGLSTLQRRTAGLPAQTQQLADGARQVAAGDRRLADAGDRLAAASRQAVDGLGRTRAQTRAALRGAGLTDAQVTAVLAQLDRLREPLTQVDATVQEQARQVDRLAAGADRVAAGADRLADAAPQLRSGVAAAGAGADRLAAGAGTLAAGERTAVRGTSRLASGADRLAAGTADVATGADRLAGSLREAVPGVPDLAGPARQRTAATIADPVAVHATATASAGTYGAGLAPFFMALACWIGGYVLFLLVRPLSARAMATNQHPVRVAVAGWLTPAALGAVQASLLTAVVSFALGIHPHHPLGAWALLVLTSVAFIAVIHALNAWLGPAGQFLGLVLMVLQLVSAGGTFPWQTLPGPLAALHHVLPMSAAIDALRQLLYGGDLGRVGPDVAVLGGYLVGALVLSSVAARRMRVWTPSRISPELAL